MRRIARLAGAALAAAPSGDIFDVYVANGGTDAIVDGGIRPAGEPTTHHADLAPADSEWCVSKGVSRVPVRSTASQTMLPSADDIMHSVNVDVDGLSVGAHYCVACRSGDVHASALVLCEDTEVL